VGENGSPVFFVYHPLLSTIRPRLLAILMVPGRALSPPDAFWFAGRARGGRGEN
jgi:hypothetical protein